MASIHTVWSVPETGVRGITVDGNPNTLGLVCPKGSIAYDTSTPAVWQSASSSSSSWTQIS